MWIRHELGHASRYAHLSEVHPDLPPGSIVEQGQVIGLIGNTGIPAAADQPESVPRLHYELWSADGSRYLGEDLTPLESHRTVATVFSRDALPRYALQVVAQVEAGQAGPDEYPPDPLPDTGFSAGPPDGLPAGDGFAAPVTWDGDDFRANDFFALLQGPPTGILEAPDGGWILGAIPMAAAGKQVTLVIGATNRYGQSLVGNRAVEATGRESDPPAVELEAASMEQYTEDNLNIESERLGQLLFQALQQTAPFWDDAFHVPKEGDVVREFGQRAFSTVLRPAQPLPGIAIEPTADPTVLASNNGLVAFCPRSSHPRPDRSAGPWRRCSFHLRPSCRNLRCRAGAYLER